MKYLTHYRWNVSKDHTLRTSESLQRCLVDRSMGVVNHPLLDFDVKDVIIDELHLMLRISDILIRNLILAMVYFDDVRQTQGHYLSTLQDSIKSCGITFRVSEIISLTVFQNHKQHQIWQAKDSHNKLEWTSLRGHERKVLLKKLPVKITSLFPEAAMGIKVKEIWEVHN